MGQPLENFGFGPYVRLGGPTYGFVHDFRTCLLDVMVFRSMVLDAMVFNPWFSTRWFSVHGFGHDGFQSIVLDALACINMYCNIERNIMKNQSGIPGFGI